MPSMLPVSMGQGGQAKCACLLNGNLRSSNSMPHASLTYYCSPDAVALETHWSGWTLVMVTLYFYGIYKIYLYICAKTDRTLKQDTDIHYSWLTSHKLLKTVFCNKIVLVLTKHAFHLNKAKHLIWSAIPNILYTAVFFSFFFS